MNKQLLPPGRQWWQTKTELHQSQRGETKEFIGLSCRAQGLLTWVWVNNPKTAEAPQSPTPSDQVSFSNPPVSTPRASNTLPTGAGNPVSLQEEQPVLLNHWVILSIPTRVTRKVIGSAPDFITGRGSDDSRGQAWGVVGPKAKAAVRGHSAGPTSSS